MGDKKAIQVGGQAVIEGVMMRGPSHISTAVRRANGEIEIWKKEFISKTKANKFLGLPIVRGFVSLIEMMGIGFSSLSFSEERASLDWKADEEAKGKTIKEKSAAAEKRESFLMYVIAFGLAFVLFGFLPYQIADWLGLGKENLWFNLFAGGIRIIFFVVYVWVISRMKDVHRLFEYHGAEHKTVYAYEKGTELDPAHIQYHSTLHPRCGTSFMFFVLLISILVFSLIDTIVGHILGSIPPIIFRLGYHLLLIPFVSGISYEVLKLSGKKIDHPLVKLMTAPGMALQRITTQPPSNDQIEIALTAMQSALDLEVDREVIYLDFKGNKK
ncbi:MAG: DUF1385 domain-containing protein [Candidatus Cloacimonetes bacterium]|nr:DUF1385 domain-containing protein [Candidatus Cloacimonadota bacterium]